jgi:hypothetical protein
MLWIVGIGVVLFALYVLVQMYAVLNMGGV